MGYKIKILMVFALVTVTSMGLLRGLGYAHLVYPFIALFSILQFTAVTKRFLRYEILSGEVKIPAKLSFLERELLQLGFVPHAVLKLTYYFMPQRQWFYVHSDERVYAYINEELESLWFSSYFDDNFDVSTRFKEGDTIKSKKIVSNVVKKSVNFAFLFHLRECQRYKTEHRNLLLFSDIEEHWAWTQGQKIEKEFLVDGLKNVLKTWGFMAIGFIVTILVSFILLLVLAFILPDQVQSHLELFIQVFGFIALSVMTIIALRQIVNTKFVDKQKNRKL